MAVLKALVVLLVFVTHSFAEPKRIISLAPNVTETLYYLGVIDKVIAVSQFCNWTEELKKKPKVGGMLNPSFEKILALKPDLVIISKHGTPKEVYQRLKDLKIKLHVFAPKSLKELPHEIVKLGKTIEKTKEAEKISIELQKEIKKIKKVYNSERALFILWSEPLVVVDKSSHIDEIMRILGLRNIAEFSSINIERIIKMNPEIIFFGLGHGFEPTVIHQLKDTDAVKKAHIYFVSDKIYRLSPRIIEGIKEMAEIGYNFNK